MSSKKPQTTRGHRRSQKGVTGRPRFKPTAAQRRKVVRLRAKGWRHTEIAESIGINPATLRRHFRDELGPPQPAPIRVTQADRRQVSVMAGGGMTQREIALVMGMSLDSLREHFVTELTQVALERRAELLMALHREGKKGKVSAARAYLQNPVLASTGEDREETRGRRGAGPKAPPKGKKEQAAEDAQSAAVGTDWDGLLPTMGTTIQ